MSVAQNILDSVLEEAVQLFGKDPTPDQVNLIFISRISDALHELHESVLLVQEALHELPCLSDGGAKCSS